MDNIKNNSTDNILWHKVMDGDIRAIEEIYIKYSERLYQYGLKFITNIELIEDCIQELFVRLIKNHKSLNEVNNIETYLLKAFRNNLFRMVSRENKYFLSNSEEVDFNVHFSAENKLIQEEEKKIKHKILIDGLNKLSERQKEAIYLRYTQGQSYEDISLIMNMSVESCRNSVYRAIKSLRSNLNKSDLIFLLLFQKKFQIIEKK